MALGAGAEGGVEGEAARLELGHVEAAVGAGHGGGEQLLRSRFAGDGDEDQAVGQLQSFGDGGFEALFDGGLAAGCESCSPLPQSRGSWGTVGCSRRL